MHNNLQVEEMPVRKECAGKCRNPHPSYQFWIKTIQLLNFKGKHNCFKGMDTLDHKDTLERVLVSFTPKQ